MSSAVNSRPEVSVIVAFYNVEDYAEKCVESLLNQSYRSLEIILVDDGSTDGTPRQLDRYAGYQHVRVFHKQNGGLSDARNYGVEKAGGRYVVFVDGDDVVAPNYVETLAKAISGEASALAIGQYKPISKEAIDAKWWDETASEPVLIDDKRTAVERLLYEEITASALAKLGPRELYVEHPFPTGVYYEEIRTAATYLCSVDKVFLIDERIYGYVMRPGSITHRNKATLQQAIDLYDAVGILEKKCEEYLQNDADAYAFHRTLQNSRLLRLLKAVPKTSEVKQMRRQAMREIRQNILSVLGDQRVKLVYKLRFGLLSVSPSAYDAVYSVYESKKIGTGGTSR